MKHLVTDDFLLPLGHIVVSFSLLEEQVQFFLMALINETQFVGLAITSEMSFRNLRGCLISVFKSKNKVGCETELEKLDELTKRAGQAESKRNQIFHSSWTCGDSNDQTLAWRTKYTAKEKKGLRSQSEFVSAEDLRQFGDELLTLATAFDDLLTEFCHKGIAKDTRGMPFRFINE